MSVAAKPAHIARSLSKYMDMEKSAVANTEGDMYAQYKLKQREYEFLKIQVVMRRMYRAVDRTDTLAVVQIEYIKDEQRHLKREMLRAQEVCCSPLRPTLPPHCCVHVCLRHGRRRSSGYSLFRS